MKVEHIKDLWLSGFVNRWHNNTDTRLRNSQDLVGGHTTRVAILYWGLFGDDPGRPVASHLSQLLSALLHDAPEKNYGDIPAPAKHRCPEINDSVKDMEVQWFYDRGMANYSHKTPEINMCDLLDAVLFCKLHARSRWETDPWQRDSRGAVDMADAIQDGLGQKVWDLIDTIDA